MTLYLNLRQLKFGGYVISTPYVMSGNGKLPGNLTMAAEAAVRAVVRGRNILFFVHGFNVNFDYGAWSFENMVPLLGMQGSDLAIGVLWPGDSWVPYINYPIEGGVAVSAGKALAAFCRRVMVGARSFSFCSHSLGARVVLQALLGLDRPARSVTLAAGAINQDCLIEEYRAAMQDKVMSLGVLASKGDRVLRLAFPPGDFLSDLLGPDHNPFEPALGYAGPATAEATLVDGDWAIPYAQGAGYPPNYDHGSYLPPGDAASEAAAAAISGVPTYKFVAEHFRNAFYGRAQSWP